ncbi:TD and POZ domain-containing protein 1-like [Cimex lectularius]|uniref:BTB domain-containing protein n=1 Tax=Cimex lectularius TaxID=79782 RepID=A0A8I6RKM9_CIMLE|nr:TD and POZ domain-containing protein 1-like [Cimex lectularius]
MSPHADWREEHRLLVEKIQYIYLSGVLSNIVLTVKNGTMSKDFKAHSLFLAMASPVLEKIIGKQQAKHSKKTIEVLGVNPQVFESFLDYIYLERVNWQSFEQACELFKLADKYRIVHLKQLCEKYIRENVNGNTACMAYEFAKTHDLIDLIESCKSVMQEKTSEVITNSFFPKIQLTTLLMILEQNMLNISEITLFKSIEFWIKEELERRGLTESQDSTEKQELYNEIMPKLCFLSMTSQEFSEGPAEKQDAFKGTDVGHTSQHINEQYFFSNA